MTRATTVVVTNDPKFGSECQEAFRDGTIFPVVVGNIDRAVSLLRQFRADVVVLDCPDPSTVENQRLRMMQAAGETPVLIFQTLPSPSVLATTVRETLARQNAADQ